MIKRRALVGALVALAAGPIAQADASTAAPSVGTVRAIAGTITGLAGSTFTIQTPGSSGGVVNRLTAAATAITDEDYPYVWGGGHTNAGISSVGMKGPGFNGKRRGYDCSGAVAAVLAGAGLWPAGTSVPNDAGIIAELLHDGLIARGAGTGPVEVTLYDDPGVHIFMSIDGRFFGTSDGAGGGDIRGGAGWLADGAPDASQPAFRRYHFLAKTLQGSTSSGHIEAFETGELPDAVVQPGQSVQVNYTETPAGRFIATDIAYPGAVTTSGSVLSIAEDRSSFTIQTPTAGTLTLATDGAVQLLQEVAAADTVEVAYTQHGSMLTAHAVTITAFPPPSTGLEPIGPSGPTVNTEAAGSPVEAITTPPTNGTTEASAEGS